jgi:alpha-methylacyl-CoA racemase
LNARTGPLAGITVVEMAGLGPTPFCATLLANAGAEIVRVDRPGGSAHPLTPHLIERDRDTHELDLKTRAGRAAALDIVAHADALVEGYRPGVMERLGLGPETCLARNPKLVYARITGWGQTGPLANSVGHDLNYIALTGALAAIGSSAEPVVPLNLLGDYGGGALYAAFGIACALLAARTTGRGQIVDAAMLDGAASLMSPVYALLAQGIWKNERAANPLDGGAHFYGVYRCKDGKWLAVAPIEPAFYREFLRRLEITDPAFEDQWARARWPELRGKLAGRFAERARAEWCALLEGSDACVSPVLDLEEAPRHPHNVARAVFETRDGAVLPCAAPRFPVWEEAPPGVPKTNV